MRICLCIAEDDLRSWVMEELLLMTWIAEQPTFVTTSDLTAVEAGGVALLIVDAGCVTGDTLVPTIAIGPDPGIPGIHVLPARLTSRELKQAIRVAVPPVSRRSESATV